MKSGMMFNQGEIVIVPFPFSDLSSIKQRPVLVLSNDDYNNFTDDVITCGITSNIKDSGHSVLITNEDLELGSIPIESRIKVDKLFTLEKSIIKKKIAKVKSHVMEQVKEKFLKLI